MSYWLEYSLPPDFWYLHWLLYGLECGQESLSDKWSCLFFQVRTNLLVNNKCTCLLGEGIEHWKWPAFRGSPILDAEKLSPCPWTKLMVLENYEAESSVGTRTVQVLFIPGVNEVFHFSAVLEDSHWHVYSAALTSPPAVTSNYGPRLIGRLRVDILLWYAHSLGLLRFVMGTCFHLITFGKCSNTICTAQQNPVVFQMPWEQCDVWKNRKKHLVHLGYSRFDDSPTTRQISVDLCEQLPECERQRWVGRQFWMISPSSFNWIPKKLKQDGWTWGLGKILWALLGKTTWLPVWRVQDFYLSCRQIWLLRNSASIHSTPVRAHWLDGRTDVPVNTCFCPCHVRCKSDL